MKTVTTKATAEAAEGTLFRGDDWFHPLGAGVRTRIRAFIEELPEAERDAALGRDRMNGLGLPRPAFKRRIKTQTVLPPEGIEGGGTAAMLFWASPASGQNTMRKVDGRRSRNERLSDQTIDLVA
jgi:hypothetical protein